MRDSILGMIKDSISQAVYSFTNPQVKPENWEMVALLNHLKSIAIPVEVLRFENINDFTQEKLIDYIYQTTLNKYEEKEKQFGDENMREVERVVLLRVIDTKWMEHIDSMDQMRKEIGVRAMGNDDPVRAYTNTGFDMYEEMTNAIQEETVRLMMGVEIRQNIERKQVLKPDEEGFENPENPEEANNRAERRRLKREAKKGNIKGN